MASGHIRPDVLQAVRSYRPRGTTNADRLIWERGGRCEGCGYEFTGANGYQFDWHHKDPRQKKASLARLARHSLERQREEADKCFLLCKMCHADQHYYRPANKSVPNINLLQLT